MKKFNFISLLFFSFNSLALTGGSLVTLDDFKSDGPQRSVVAIDVDFRDDDDRSNNSRDTCGGVILSDKRILTAAHCLPKRKIRQHINIHVLYGPSSYTSNFYDELIDESQIVRHPGYTFKKTKQFKYSEGPDLAVIQLNVALPREAQPAFLPDEGYILSPPVELILSGYGSSELTANQTKSEAIGSLRIGSNQQLLPSGDSSHFSISQDTGTGICIGDSGSPAFLQKGPKLVVVGIARQVFYPLTPEQQEQRKEMGLREFLNRNSSIDFCKHTGLFYSIMSELP